MSNMNLQEDRIAASDRTNQALAGTRMWFGLRNPRIVRVPRNAGGKDRHSKVRTVRGLRDRRVRLSVPTATFIYDLQDKLGLSQPSKVVEWLMNAARSEIDRLPPLPSPFGPSGLNSQPHSLPNQVQSHHTGAYAYPYGCLNQPLSSMVTEDPPAVTTTAFAMFHPYDHSNFFDINCMFNLPQHDDLHRGSSQPF